MKEASSEGDEIKLKCRMMDALRAYIEHGHVSKRKSWKRELKAKREAAWEGRVSDL